MLKLSPPRHTQTSLRERRRARSLAIQRSSEKKWYVSPVGDKPHPADPDIPDILHSFRWPWGDLQNVARLIRFSFEGGESTGVFDALVEATPLSPSSWNPDAFAPHLFLDQLVSSCIQVEIEDKRLPVHHNLLTRIISHPPQDPADTEVRQHVFRELQDSPNLRADLEKVFVNIHNLRSRLEDSPIDDSDTISRKIDVLAAIRDCIDALSDGFESARSRLSHLRKTGQNMRASRHYARLLQLLDLEGNLATVDVRLRLGADGHIRALNVLSVKENTENPLLPTIWERAWQRIFGMLRGHRYEQREVLVSLLHEVFRPLVDVVMTCMALIGPIEFYLAGVGFRDLARSKGLQTCLPEVVNSPAPNEDRGIARELKAIFNPLLLLQEALPIPTDIRLERHDGLLLLSGPNSGGKTRILQAIAIVQCLGQVGMPVPAAKALIVRAPTMFVSLIDELGAAQSEGRLGTELVRIRKLFESLEPGTMAILDELCSGTNPTEGEAIAKMVISLLPKLHPQVFISTHFLGLAQRLFEERPVQRLFFLEVELDAAQRPTYSFVPGVAKTSLAHVVAARLGVTREELEKIVDDRMSAVLPREASK